MKKKYIELEAEESGDEGKHSVNSTEDENEDNLVFDEDKIKELLGLDTELLSSNDNHEKILRIDLFKENSDIIKSNEKNDQNKRKYDRVFKSNSQGKKIDKDRDNYKIKIDFNDKSISQTFPAITRLDLLTKKPNFYIPDETTDNELLEMMEEKKMRELTINCSEIKKSFIKRVTQNNKFIKETIVNLNDEDYLLSKKKMSTKGCKFKIAYKSNGKCKLVPDKKSIEAAKENDIRKNKDLKGKNERKEEFNCNFDKNNNNNNTSINVNGNKNSKEEVGFKINEISKDNCNLNLKRNNSQIINKSMRNNDIFEENYKFTNNESNFNQIGNKQNTNNSNKYETNSFSQLIKNVSTNSQSISYISSQNRIVKKTYNNSNSVLNNINQGKAMPKIKEDTRQITNISSLFYITERNKLKEDGSKKSMLKDINFMRKDLI